ncbi:AraC family transcriptional regulator [Aquincola sp. S2]|uniref:AraC family transcriptional regulator n=1 Tax=Pseudaquabacterium terrae TaxID=2732868 RepID=A0ABX2EKE1_9BURK|nr:AraC family transcriptional regulator [Aquabacterium terrae]
MLLLGLLAAWLWRDQRRARAARLGAGFSLGVAAYVLCAFPGFAAWPMALRAPLLAASAGNAVLFWLFASALFDDEFRSRRGHALLWALPAAGGALNCTGVLARQAEILVGHGITLVTLGFALAALAQTLSSWRADLVERRRWLRGFIVGAGGVYTLVTMLGRLPGSGAGGGPPGTGLADALLLSAIVGVVVWRLGGVGATPLLPLDEPAAAVDAPPPAAPFEARAADTPVAATATPPDPQEDRLLATLQRVMHDERLYRQPGLTIGALANRLAVPEYRLRRLVNQRLGQRNFNSWLNGYRIADVRAALADPAQAEVPVLTLAMDAGFTSLGPFNRAFKAETGTTPTEYRRLSPQEQSAPGRLGLADG